MADIKTQTDDMAVGCDGQPIEATLLQWIEGLIANKDCSVSEIALFNGGCITDDLKVASDEINKLRSLLNQRDDFIVRADLWPTFVDTLPRS